MSRFDYLELGNPWLREVLAARAMAETVPAGSGQVPESVVSSSFWVRPRGRWTGWRVAREVLGAVPRAVNTIALVCFYVLGYILCCVWFPAGLLVLLVAHLLHSAS